VNVIFEVLNVLEITTNMTANRQGWKFYCRFWLTSIDSMKTMQMTSFRNTQSTLMNSETDLIFESS